MSKKWILSTIVIVLLIAGAGVFATLIIVNDSVKIERNEQMAIDLNDYECENSGLSGLEQCCQEKCTQFCKQEGYKYKKSTNVHDTPSECICQCSID